MPKKTDKKDISIRSSAAEYLTFVAATGDDKNSVEVRYENENIWITQKMLAVLYEVDVRTINYHIKKIFEDSELTEDSVIRKFRITAEDGKSYDTMHYNLQMIIAVGFKVNSERAVQFRKWVNRIAKDYTIQGWVLDSDRLKNGGSIYLDFAEMQANRNIPMTMEDWAKHLDRILMANEQEILTNAGKISMEVAKEHAETEWAKYRIIQDRIYQSDFDLFLEDVKKLEKK